MKPHPLTGIHAITGHPLRRNSSHWCDGPLLAGQRPSAQLIGTDGSPQLAGSAEGRWLTLSRHRVFPHTGRSEVESADIPMTASDTPQTLVLGNHRQLDCTHLPRRVPAALSRFVIVVRPREHG